MAHAQSAPVPAVPVAEEVPVAVGSRGWPPRRTDDDRTASEARSLAPRGDFDLASYNRVILVGNLTRDPELRYIQSGTAVTDVGLAVNDRRKTATGEWVEETTFVDVTVWGRQAETVCEYLTKGSPVLVRRAA